MSTLIEKKTMGFSQEVTVANMQYLGILTANHCNGPTATVNRTRLQIYQLVEGMVA